MRKQRAVTIFFLLTVGIIICLPTNYFLTISVVSPLKVQGKDIINGLGRKVILRGFNALSYDMCRKDGGYPFYQSDFDLVASWGFNVFRFILNWAFIEPYESQLGIYDEAVLQIIDEQIEYCRKSELKVILGFHCSWWYWANNDVVYQQPERFAALWEMMAERYDDDTAVIGFNPIIDAWHPDNREGGVQEPDPSFHGFYDLTLIPMVISSIRQHSNKIIFLMSWIDATLYKQNDPNVVYMVNNYSPGKVTHQGQYYTGDTTEFEQRHQIMIDFQNTYNVPVMCNAWGIKMPLDPDRLQWIDDGGKIMNETDTGWLYWIYGYDGRASEMAVLNPDHTERSSVDVLKKYAPKLESAEEPTTPEEENNKTAPTEPLEPSESPLQISGDNTYFFIGITSVATGSFGVGYIVLKRRRREK